MRDFVLKGLFTRTVNFVLCNVALKVRIDPNFVGGRIMSYDMTRHDTKFTFRVNRPFTSMYSSGPNTFQCFTTLFFWNGNFVSLNTTQHYFTKFHSNPSPKKPEPLV
jgi:hypothetical protein